MSDVRRQKKLFSTQFEVRQSFLLTNYEFRLTGLVKRSALWEKNIKIGRFTGRCFWHGRYLGGVFYRLMYHCQHYRSANVPVLHCSFLIL